MVPWARTRIGTHRFAMRMSITVTRESGRASGYSHVRVQRRWSSATLPITSGSRGMAGSRSTASHSDGSDIVQLLQLQAVQPGDHLRGLDDRVGLAADRHRGQEILEHRVVVVVGDTVVAKEA